MTEKTELQVRDARPEDANVIARFNQDMAWETEARELDSETVLAGVRNGIARQDRCRYFVAELQDQVIGQAMITFEWSDWRDGELWWLQSVYVHPDQRGKGIFRSLFQHIETLARKQGQVRGLRLYVETENEVGQEVYSRLGMTHSGYHVYEMEFKMDGR